MTAGHHRIPSRALPVAVAVQHGVSTWIVMACASVIPQGSAAQTGSVRPADAGASKASVIRRVESGPSWNELPAHQRLALKPLAEDWNAMSEAQKRKWIALLRNFDKLPAQEQLKLQDRMGDWVALSAKERSRARLNFAETKKLSVDEKQAKWQAYQALSDDERRKLAEQAPRRKLPGAATAVRPAAASRLAQVPASQGSDAKVPRISAAPHQVHPNTLLPQVDSPSAGLNLVPAQ